MVVDKYGGIPSNIICAVCVYDCVSELALESDFHGGETESEFIEVDLI